MYEIDIATGRVVAGPMPLPMELVGLAPGSLADLSAALDPCPERYRGRGFWPARSGDVPFDPDTQRPSDQMDETPDPVNKTVVVTPLVVNLTPAELEARLFAARTARKDALASLRWQRECGGITMPDGSVIATDDRSKTLLNGKYRTAEKHPDRLHRWKGAESEITLTSAQVIAIGDAVSDHVQDCFDRELDLIAEIDAAQSAEAVLAIDITTGWPGPEAP